MAEARRLDPTQRAAAAADAPVQLTLAGPGAGKTTTLAVRFVHLVRQGVDPRRILAVTFTRKAAIEHRGVQPYLQVLPELGHL
jgi:DNA helicase II / ATP-dependent DNA helicase PcrA